MHFAFCEPVEERVPEAELKESLGQDRAYPGPRSDHLLP